MTPLSGEPGPELMVSLPDQSLLACDAASVTYRRHFNRPTGLSPQTAVVLICGLIPLADRAELNGHVLSAPFAGEMAIDITQLLLPHNQLAVEICCDRYGDAASASARLEIIEATTL